MAIRQVIQDTEHFSKSISFIAPLDSPSRNAGSSSQYATRRLLQVLISSRTGNDRTMDPYRLRDTHSMANTFLSFLANPSGSSPFSRIALAHDQLATMCLDVLSKELQFNICKFPSSFMRNREVRDLTMRADSAISSRLRYACQYWMDHVGQLVEMRSGMLEQILDFFQTQFLPWLEVMSILELPPADALGKLLSNNVRYS